MLNLNYFDKCDDHSCLRIYDRYNVVICTIVTFK